MLVQSFVALIAFIATIFPIGRADAAAPTVAPIVKVYDQKPGQVLLYWSTVPDATNYQVTVTIGNTSTLRTTSLTKLTLTGLPVNQPMTFFVVGQNADGTGPVGTTTFTQPGTPPTNPVTGFQLTTTRNGRIVLRWTPTTNATLHRIRLQDDDNTGGGGQRLWVTGGTALIIGTLNANNQDYPFINAAHTYRTGIRAANATGFGPETEFLSRLDHPNPPAQPSTPLVTPTSISTAFVSWQPQPDATFFDVYVGESISTIFQQAPLQTTGNMVNLTGLSPGRQYFVIVRGHNIRGQGNPSTIVRFRTVQPPSPPILSLTNNNPPVLSWNPDPTVTRYMLEYNTGGSVTTIDSVTSPLNLPGLPPSTTTTARIKAINPAGETWSNTVTIQSPPEAPTIFEAVAGAGRVTLHWSSVPNATDYVIYTNNGMTPGHSGPSLTTTNTSATVTELQHGTYTFVVTARRNGAESTDSAPVTATVNLLAVSRTHTGQFGNAASTIVEGAALSATGRFTLFFTNATNLSDLNTGNSLMIHDQELGTLDFVANIGTLAGRGRHATTPDGHTTVFTSNDATLAMDDTNNATDVFIADTTTGELLRVSVDEAGQEIPGTSTNPYISDDGNEILFMTSGLGGGIKPYLHHRLLGFSEAALITLTGQDGTGEPCGLSADGQVLAVLSTTTSATDLDPDPRFRNRKQLYVRDIQAGLTRGESASSDIDRNNFINGTPANNHVTNCALSHDAKFVAFETVADNLVTGDTNAKKDVFLRDLRTGSTERVSLSDTGGQLTDDSSLVTIATPSDNGIAVVFKTKAPVRSGDPTFSTPRYYAWYRPPTGTPIVFPLLDPSNPAPSKLTVSRDGSAMAMETTASLLPGDTNGVSDVYLDIVNAP